MLDTVLTLLDRRASSYSPGLQTTVCWRTDVGWLNCLTKIEFFYSTRNLPPPVAHEYKNIAIYRRHLPTANAEQCLRQIFAEGVLKTGGVVSELPSAGQFSVGGRTRWHHSEWSEWPADVFKYQPTSHQNWPPDESLIALDAPYFPSLNQVLSELFSIKSTGWTNYLQGQIVVTLPDFRARLSNLTIALAHLRANIECLLLKPTDLVAKVYAESQVRRLLQETVKPDRPSIEFDLSDKPSFACVGLLCAKTGDLLDERAFREGVSWREPGVTIEEDLPNIEQMLLSGESETVEFREKLDRSRPERLARTAVAFANTRGGTIVFGVDDDHRVVGCSIKGMADDITNILRSHCDPPPATRSSIATHQGKELFLLEVSEAQNSIHVVKEQGVFIRANGTNRAPTSHELSLLVDSRRSSASALPQLLSSQLSLI